METDTILRKRILLVDDERLVRESIRGLLAKDEHLIVEANNGAEAYSLFVRGKFDLVVTDCVMPFLSGNELAVRIRQLAPEQPILMLTGHDFKPCRSNPVDAILQKPFDCVRFQKELAKLL